MTARHGAYVVDSSPENKTEDGSVRLRTDRIDKEDINRIDEVGFLVQLTSEQRDIILQIARDFTRENKIGNFSGGIADFPRMRMFWRGNVPQNTMYTWYNTQTEQLHLQINGM